MPSSRDNGFMVLVVLTFVIALWALVRSFNTDPHKDRVKHTHVVGGNSSGSRAARGSRPLGSDTVVDVPLGLLGDEFVIPALSTESIDDGATIRFSLPSAVEALSTMAQSTDSAMMMDHVGFTLHAPPQDVPITVQVEYYSLGSDTTITVPNGVEVRCLPFTEDADLFGGPSVTFNTSTTGWRCEAHAWSVIVP